MDRLIVRAAALAALALFVAGCSSNPLDASALTGPAAEQAAKDADASGSDKNLADNLDDQIRNAQLLRAKGDFDGASRVLGQLMLMSPDDPRIIGEYGKVLAQRGRSGDAAAFLNRAVQLQPNDWMLYSALGVVEDQLGDHEKARIAYGNALRINPGEPSVLNNFALSRMLAGDLPMAASLSAQAAARGGSDPKIVANQEMIAGMMRARGETAAPLSAASPQGAMRQPVQPVAVQQRPSPTMASGAPKPLIQSASASSPAAAPSVVMQKVPFDPYAGPVKSSVAQAKPATAAPRALAHAAPPALKKRVAEDAAPKNPVPALRTAAD